MGDPVSQFSADILKILKTYVLSFQCYLDADTLQCPCSIFLVENLFTTVL